MNDREGSGENALNAAGDYIRRHRGKGVPAALVLVLLAGAVYATNLNSRVEIVERDTSELKEDVKKIKEDIGKIKEGSTEYQKRQAGRQEENFRAIQRALGIRPLPTLPPHHSPAPHEPPTGDIR